MFQLCFVIDALLSPDDILALSPGEDNTECITVGLFLHYFLLAQYSWIATQVSCTLGFIIIELGDQNVPRGLNSFSRLQSRWKQYLIGNSDVPHW